MQEGRRAQRRRAQGKRGPLEIFALGFDSGYDDASRRCVSFLPLSRWRVDSCPDHSYLPFLLESNPAHVGCLGELAKELSGATVVLANPRDLATPEVFLMSRVSSSRRDFLKSMSATALGSQFLLARAATAAAVTTRSANQQVNIACCGVGGKGYSDMVETSAGHNIVAICDLDAGNLARAAQQFPKAKTYRDWRQMLEQTDIDAVTVSTPDHMHAPVTLTAIELGKHVYTQKPLTHNVWESRQLAKAAEKAGVITQMGTQHHSAARIKNAVQLIQDGAIGKVSEVHAWTDRPGNYWKQGLQRPGQADPVPADFDWDAWVGVAPMRPYNAGLYHPFHWRGWWDFGTGAGGDMGCHLLDPVFTALQLTAPKTVAATGPEPDADSGPTWCVVDYLFPGTQYTSEEVKLTWYESGRKPAAELIKAPNDWPGSENGVLFVGAKGNLFVGFPEPAQLFPVEDFAEYSMPAHEEGNHYTQWTAAITGEGSASCPFSYAAPLTEAVLLGGVAYRSGETLNWDSAALKTGSAKADIYLKRAYRDGWKVPGLG